MFNCDNRKLLVIVVAHILFAVLYFTTTFSGGDNSQTTTYERPSSSSSAFQQHSGSSSSTSSSADSSSSSHQQQANGLSPSSSGWRPSSSSSSSSSSFTKIPTTSGGIYWPELGNIGWRRPTRNSGESSWMCKRVRTEIEKTYKETTKNVNLNGGPRFGMPWFFHEPYPVCGSILLRHLHGSMDTAHVLRILNNENRNTDDDEYIVVDPEEVRRKVKAPHSSKLLSSILLEPLSFKTNDRQFRDIFGDLDTFREVVDVVAGVRFDDSVAVENCGDRLGFSNVLITARLVSFNFIVAAPVEEVVVAPYPSSSSSSASSQQQQYIKVALEAPAPGSYVLEVKTVHANGTSDNPRVPRSLGVVGIRAVVGGRKAFMYNTKCDFQRHVSGSPVLVRAHAPDSQIGRALLLRWKMQQNKISSSSSSPSSSSSHSSNSNNNINLPSSAASSSSSSPSTPPLCRRGDYTHGFWARMANPKLCHAASNPFCAGDPEWVTDASAYNTQYVWVPTHQRKSADGTLEKSNQSSSSSRPLCKYQYFTPPHGPARSCLRHGESRAFLYLVGDSVIREYAKSCELLSLRSARLQCLFANIALEGQHFSDSYAASVAKTIVSNVRENNAGVFATNLGLQHMIGPCTTRQWRIFVRYFVLYWKAQIVWAKGAGPTKKSSSSSSSTDDGDDAGDGEQPAAAVVASRGGDSSNLATFPPSEGASTSDDISKLSDEDKVAKYYLKPKFIRTQGEFPKLEQAIWIGPPTIQYARKGMGAERAALWDEIAWRELKPLGFRRFRTAPITAARQEATWDGLHYASERNKVQTAWKNKDAKVYKWSGGVANVLMTILLNMVCNRP